MCKSSARQGIPKHQHPWHDHPNPTTKSLRKWLGQAWIPNKTSADLDLSIGASSLSASEIASHHQRQLQLTASLIKN
jgi:hypothetical protein